LLIGAFAEKETFFEKVKAYEYISDGVGKRHTNGLYEASDNAASKSESAGTVEQ